MIKIFLRNMKRAMLCFIFFSIFVFHFSLSFGQTSTKEPKTKKWVVDVFIQTYVINNKEVDSYIDDKGKEHFSNKDYYTVPVVHGANGGPVQYRYHIEHVRLTRAPGDDNAAPLFKNSTSELIDSSAVPQVIITQLPATYSKSPNHK